MSTTIIFGSATAALTLPNAVRQMEAIVGPLKQRSWNEYLATKQYNVIVSEVGSNNCIDEQGRISRHWAVEYLGDDPMYYVIDCAKSVEGEMTRFRSGRTTAESYIAHYRKLLKTPVVVNDHPVLLPSFEVDLLPRFRHEKYPNEDLHRHPLTAWLFEQGLLVEQDKPEYRCSFLDKSTYRLRVPVQGSEHWEAIMFWLFLLPGEYRSDAKGSFDFNWRKSDLSGWARSIAQSFKAAPKAA